MIRRLKNRIWDFIYEYHIDETNKLNKDHNMVIMAGNKLVTIKLFGIKVKKCTRVLDQSFVNAPKNGVGFKTT